MRAIEEKLQVQNLTGIAPDMHSDRPLGHAILPRGNSSYLNFCDTMQFVGVLEFKPNSGIKGNHYHHERTEILYLVAGTLRGLYWLPGKPHTVQERIHNKGDVITILPGLVHGFEAIEYSTAVELSAARHNASDIYYDS